ncbi:hypothetical protein [Companilactobacillus jidongensis]|nr:hypothetical protein [Companilactobacillus jidongensis]
MKLLDWIKLVIQPQDKSEMSVQDKEFLSELEEENKASLFDSK